MPTQRGIPQRSTSSLTIRNIEASNRSEIDRLLILCLVFTLVFAQGCGTKSVSAAAPPPPNVQVAEVVQQNVPIYHEYIATLDGYVNAVIQPQVSGYLVKQNYREGAV